MALDDTVYIYWLLDPKTGLPRYVGKTCFPAARIKAHYKEQRNTKKCAWVKGLITQNLLPIMEIVEITDQQNWQEREKWWITVLLEKGLKLTNGTAGGDGVQGRKTLTPEHRENIRLALMKRTYWRRGWKRSAEANEQQQQSRILNQKNGKVYAPNSKPKYTQKFVDDIRSMHFSEGLKIPAIATRMNMTIPQVAWFFNRHNTTVYLGDELCVL